MFFFYCLWLQQFKASTSYDAPPAPGVSPTVNENSERVGDLLYADTVAASEGADVQRSSFNVSAVLRQKFRPLMQGIVDKASRVVRKDQKLLGDVSQVC